MLEYLIYKKAFGGGGDFNIAMAISVVKFLAIAAISIVIHENVEKRGVKE